MYIELYLNGKKRTKGRKSCHLWWVWCFQTPSTTNQACE